MDFGITWPLNEIIWGSGEYHFVSSLLTLFIFLFNNDITLTYKCISACIPIKTTMHCNCPVHAKEPCSFWKLDQVILYTTFAACTNAKLTIKYYSILFYSTNDRHAIFSSSQRSWGRTIVVPSASTCACASTLITQ